MISYITQNIIVNLLDILGIILHLRGGESWNHFLHSLFPICITSFLRLVLSYKDDNK
jgi:hypothetical protein